MLIFKTLLKKELQLAFFSLKAWVIWFVLLLVMGLFFFNYVDSLILSQQQGSNISITLEQMVFSYFNVIHFSLVLLIPGITMNLFSEEKQKGTFVLLQSLPISSLNIVLAKYFSIVILLGGIFISSFIFPAFLLTYGSFDPGILIASYLGLFLACCLYVSIGVFCALFASHSFYGYLSSFILCFFLTILSSFSPYSDQASLLKKSFLYFSSSDHLNSFFKGYLHIADISYFLLIASFLMLLSVACLDHQRRNAP